VGSLLRSASVGRERSTATPPAALIKLRESASKSKARRQGGRRRQGPAGHAGRGFGAGTEENRSDDNTRDRRFRSRRATGAREAAVLPSPFQGVPSLYGPAQIPCLFPRAASRSGLKGAAE